MEALQIPATVQTILAARIDRLPAEEKQLLQTASVIGKDIPYAILKAIVEQPEEILRQGLAHLQKAEFLYETHLFPELKHTFKHALTHEVTYGSLLQDRRRQLHAQIVAAIERLYADRLSEHLERLAHHALRGHRWDKAVRYGREAGNRAFERSAQTRGAHSLRTGVGRAARAARETGANRAAHRPVLRAAEYLHVARRVRANGRGPQRGARTGGGARGSAAARAGTWASGVALRPPWRARAGHRSVGARVCHRRGGRRARAARRRELLFGPLSSFAGDPRRAAEPARTVIALVEGAPFSERLGTAGPPAAHARWILGVCQAEAGEFAQALAAGEEGLGIAQTAGHPFTEVWVRWGLG